MSTQLSTGGVPFNSLRNILTCSSWKWRHDAIQAPSDHRERCDFKSTVVAKKAASDYLAPELSQKLCTPKLGLENLGAALGPDGEPS